MFPSLIITFRETLEATLIIGLVLSYLSKTKQTKYNSMVYHGSFFGILASIVGAFLFSKLTNGFSGEIEKIFEGITMIVASSLIATMIIWMTQQKDLSKKLTNKMTKKIELAKKVEVFFLVFFAILREGIETVLFITAANLGSNNSYLIPSLIGVFISLIIGYLIFKTSKKINIKLFFKLSTFLLILFSSGLFAHGIHEFQEVGVIPIIVEHIWDTNYILHEESIMGGFIKDLFGYNGNPSLIEFSSYIIYLSGFWFILKNKKEV